MYFVRHLRYLGQLAFSGCKTTNQTKLRVERMCFFPDCEVVLMSLHGDVCGMVVHLSI